MRLSSTRPAAAAALLTVALALTGCSTGSANEKKETPDAASAVDEGAFPVTIDHAFGSTTIEEEPKRVATLGWTDQDAVLALGVIPVGSTKLNWGGNAAGSSDWFDAELEALGGTQPVRYDDTDGAPVAEVAELAPDVIVATNAGITEKEYAKLSKIAPVVAYPDAPWVTSWQDTLDMVGQALGRNALADDVAAETDAAIAAAAEQNPELDGTSVLFTYMSTADLSSVGVYLAEDNRVRILEELGMVSPPVLDEIAKPGEFYTTVSAERASELDSDVVLTYAEKKSDLGTFTKDDLVGQMPALRSGHAYAELDKHIGLAITNPSPLSIPFLIANFLPNVVKAAEGS
jgi:iron complex transport system substrate-binding protein